MSSINEIIKRATSVTGKNGGFVNIFGFITSHGENNETLWTEAFKVINLTNDPTRARTCSANAAFCGVGETPADSKQALLTQGGSEAPGSRARFIIIMVAIGAFIVLECMTRLWRARSKVKEDKAGKETDGRDKVVSEETVEMDIEEGWVEVNHDEE